MEISLGANQQPHDGFVVNSFDELIKWVKSTLEPQIRDDAVIFVDSDSIVIKMNTTTVVPVKFGRNGWVETYSTWAARIAKMSPKSMQSFMLCITTGSEL